MKSPDSARSDRDEMVLDHIARNRITTHPVLQQACMPNLGSSAVRKITARLCRTGCLAKVEFRQRRSYFTLSLRQTKARGLPFGWSQPLGAIALPKEYAVLQYTCEANAKRKRLSLKELTTVLPDIDQQVFAAAHCLDESTQPPAMELIRVDLGGKPDHVARKCYQDVQRRRGFTLIEQMIKSGHFRLVVITASGQKARVIKAALDQHLWPAGLQIRLAVVSDLLLFL